jgi:Ca2+-binding EF-hand superfamily protein
MISIDKLFKESDKDHNSKLDRKEVKSFLNTLTRMLGEDCTNLKLDVNNDGVVTQSEFQEQLAKFLTNKGRI